MSSSVKPSIVFVLGAPGSGKGTVCKHIVNTYDFVHLSAGDLLREEQDAEGSQFGQLIKDHIIAGSIVPVEITCGLIKRAMEKSEKNKFLIDGFPRNQNNLDGWETVMADTVDLKFVLFLDCKEEACLTRCLNRGKKGSGRTDDNVESLKKRFVVFTEQSMPIIRHYEKLNLVRTINSNVPPRKVFEEVDKLFTAI